MQNDSSEAGCSGLEPGAAAQAGAAGLDLSLGHIGTEEQKGADLLSFDLAAVEGDRRRYLAICDACHHSVSEEAYQAAEALAGPQEDPPCPRCGVRLWSFHNDLL